MTKIIGVHGATNSSFHDHNHRAFVLKMLRVVENRHDKAATIAEILAAWQKPENKLVLLDALTCSAINAFEVANHYLDKEATQKAAALASPATKKGSIVVKKKEPNPHLLVAQAKLASGAETITKLAKIKATFKEALLAKVTLETVLCGKPFREWSYDDVCEAGDKFALIRARMKPGQIVADVFTEEKLAEVLAS